MESILLGLVQGLTEFLPISSSGHLVLFQKLFDISGSTLLFDLVLHLGTLCAVGVVFRDDFMHLWKSLTSGPFLVRGGTNSIRDSWCHDEAFRLWTLVVAGSVPTFIVAVLIQHPVEAAFRSVGVVGFSLVATGLFLGVTRWKRGGAKGILQVGLFEAFIIGIAQGLAVTPGISRSGITIVAGLVLGLSGFTAARFSFLLSVPAIIGGTVFEVLKQGISAGNYGISAELSGFLVAFLSGVIALKLVLGMVSSGRLYYFSYYCVPLGLLMIIA